MFAKYNCYENIIILIFRINWLFDFLDIYLFHIYIYVLIMYVYRVLLRFYFSFDNVFTGAEFFQLFNLLNQLVNFRKRLANIRVFVVSDYYFQYFICLHYNEKVEDIRTN